jgi:small GTP-binding protein
MPQFTPEQAYQETLRRIEITAKTDKKKLHLFGFSLTELPPEIWQLRMLEELYLDKNQLKTLPSDIGQLKNLQVLEIHTNQLKSLPSEIGQLQSLKKLILSKNQLTILPPEIGELYKLEALYLDENQLKKLPNEIGKFKKLQRLNLNCNQLKLLPPELGELQSLENLYITDNQLTQLPLEISQLRKLTAFDYDKNPLKFPPQSIIERGYKAVLAYLEAKRYIEQAVKNKSTTLDLSHLDLTELPPEICRLKTLKRLYIHNNQLTTLPPNIGQLKDLQILEMSTNRLKFLPSEIGQIKMLKKMILFENQLTIMPPEIGQLKNLEGLNLEDNQLKNIPNEIGQLKALQELNLGGNQLEFLPSEIGQLQSLEILCLQSNKLTALPDEIRELKALESLWLPKNQFANFPAEILQLKKLKKLNIGENKLRSIPSEIGQLQGLKVLHLYKNQLTELPPEIFQLKISIQWEKFHPKHSELSGNPLESPPVEIVKKGKAAVLEYFKSLEGEKQALNEVKVLLVGNGGSGKTSLVKQLFGEKFDPNESQTHGINIKKKDVSKDNNGTNIKVHFWDFGGQQIMHATHQFFLSKRSLYILVLDGRKEEDAEYWLKHIESFGGNSPILVVMNKINEHPFDVNRLFLQDKYKGIKGFYRISCRKKQGVNALTKGLIKALLSVEHIQTTWAKSWFNVKERLENMTEHFISYDRFKAICKKEKINENANQDTLVDFLNDLGVILHFKDFELLDTHVLEPRWVTEGVYKIINSKKLAKSNGVLELNLLDQILKKKKKSEYEYPKSKHKFLIDLMKKFELCYAIDNKSVLIPDLLEIQQPTIDFDNDTALKFIIDYDFLPKSIMPRFIVKMHKDIKNGLQWRTGVVLEDKVFDATAVIKADEKDKKIYIYVNGDQKRDYFSVIRYAFLSINSSFEKLKAIEKVPMPDNPEVTTSYKHLVTLEKKGKEAYIPDGSEKEYKVRDLLGTIYVEKRREKEMLQILRKLKDQSDSEDEESLLKKANEIIQLQPNFLGIGVNLNKLIKKLF